MRKLILAINLWLLGSLTVFAQQPAWVMSHPVESDAYVGIGFAVLEDPDYIQKATQNALNDIAMQMVAVGFIIGVIQDSVETMINSSSDALFTAVAEFHDWKIRGREVKF